MGRGERGGGWGGAGMHSRGRDLRAAGGWSLLRESGAVVWEGVRGVGGGGAQGCIRGEGTSEPRGDGHYCVRVGQLYGKG